MPGILRIMMKEICIFGNFEDISLALGFSAPRFFSFVRKIKALNLLKLVLFWVS